MQHLTARFTAAIPPSRAALQLSRSINTAVNSIYPDGPSYDFRVENKMMIRGFDPKREDYVPIKSMEAAPFHPTVMEYLNKIGLKVPTNVQAQAWPIILSGRDMVCISKSGTGKTLAYLAPLFSNLLSEPLESTAPMVPKVLILACRREEALAAANAVKPFADMCNMKTAVVTGGYATEIDVDYLKNNAADVLVATPGRCARLVKDGNLDVSQVKRIVLDEAHVLLNPFQCTDSKSVLKKLTRDGLQTVVVGGRWYQENRDVENVLLHRNKVFLQVLRPKRVTVGEPTARAMKTAPPSRRRRMLMRWRERDEKVKAAEKIELSPE